MTVSIACCTFDGATFLDAQLASLLAQTRVPDEIVVVDDGSSDDTVAIAERFARRAPAGVVVTVVRNESNLGVARNFDRAIGLVQGDLVLTCDQDDVWHADKVATIEAAFAARPELLLLHTDARTVGADGHPTGHTLFEALEVSSADLRAIHDGHAFDAYLRRNLATGATMAFRRALHALARPVPDAWIHDEWLAIVAAATGRVDVLEDALVDYRQHDGNEIGARRLGLADKFGRLRRARAARYAHLQRRAAVLVERLTALGSRVPTAHLRAAQDKLAHARFRAALPGHRALRVPAIAAELARGGYARYSLGLRSVAQDLLEPA